ncbi:MAG TPA: MBL fold metallo-hydrolase [Thermoanaerobaculia bacterium]|nr:MBL fold metallo-hydrolase [Thermoanaerobaculia bacterium]
MSGHGVFPVTIPTDRFTIEGKSRAGNETYFRIRELGIGLDIGRCPDSLVGLSHIFVTHAHLDHAVGIPFYAGQRRLQRLPPGTVYLPAETIPDFRQLMRLHEKLEGTEYDLILVGMSPGQSLPLRRNLVVRAHESSHRVVACSWEFLERRHKLRPELSSLPAGELALRRRSGESIDVERLHPILFYTGDTDRRILEENDELYRTEVLMIECSFIAPEHRELAMRYRHIHIDDLFEVSDRFENAMIVLTHFSLRYTPSEIHRTIASRCPAGLRSRLRLALPEPFDRIEPEEANE